MENENYMFENGPLRDAMVIYLQMNYEENADLSEDSMVAEYRMLKQRNELHLIFEAVQLHNYFNSQAI